MEFTRFTVTALKSFLSGFFVCNLITILVLFLFRYANLPYLKNIDTVLWTWGIFAVLGYTFDGGFRSIRADLRKGVVQLRIGSGLISMSANEVPFNKVQKFENRPIYERGSMDDSGGYVNKLGYVTREGEYYVLLSVDKKQGIMVQYQLMQLIHKYQGVLVEWSENFLKLQDFFRRNSRRHSLTAAILAFVVLTCWLVLGRL